MKKLILLSFLFASVACTNPEDSVNNNTDSAKDANTEGNTLNTNPGPTTPNSNGATSITIDSSNDPTVGSGSKATTGRAGTTGSADTTQGGNTKRQGGQ